MDKRELDKKYREEHKEEAVLYKKNWYIKNSDRLKAKRKNYYLLHKNQHTEYSIEQKDAKSKYNKEYYERNKPTLLEKKKLWKSENKTRINNYIRNRKQTDSLYKFKLTIRRRMCKIFNKLKIDKPTMTENIVGTNYATLATYIESQFKDGMTWENHGEWHIDHIIPLASAKDLDEVIALCHYSNLQPLWANENLIKGAKENICY